MKINACCSEKLESVRHFFCGRHGGHSSDKFDSLNCSRFVGDSLENVDQNLEDVRNLISAKRLLTLNQIHSNVCVVVDENSENNMEADAFVTKAEGIALGIVTADCIPLLLYDPVHKVIGAAHVGLKGVINDIVDNTLREMYSIGADQDTVVAAIGPCIHVESYEIQENLIDTLGKNLLIRLINNQYHFDLVSCCQRKLLRQFISQARIDIIDIDTYKNPQDYFSYRYATKHSDGVCGRNISVICM